MRRKADSPCGVGPLHVICIRHVIYVKYRLNGETLADSRDAGPIAIFTNSVADEICHTSCILYQVTLAVVITCQEPFILQRE